MDKLDMNVIYNDFGVKTDEQKSVLNELVYLVISGNPEGSGFTVDNRDDVRKALFGESFGTIQEKVFGVAGYWSNDLEVILAEDLGLSGDDAKIFKRLFKLLDGKEVVDGVCYKSTDLEE